MSCAFVFSGTFNRLVIDSILQVIGPMIPAAVTTLDGWVVEPRVINEFDFERSIRIQYRRATKQWHGLTIADDKARDILLDIRQFSP